MCFFHINYYCGPRDRILESTLVQWSLYFKTTHGTKKMWSYIAGGLKIKVIWQRILPFGTKSSGLIIKGGLKIEGCKIEGLLYLSLDLLVHHQSEQCDWLRIRLKCENFDFSIFEDSGPGYQIDYSWDQSIKRRFAVSLTKLVNHEHPVTKIL